MGGGSWLARENCAVLLLPKRTFPLFAPKGETRALSFFFFFCPFFFLLAIWMGNKLTSFSFPPSPSPPAAAVLVRLKDLFLPFCEALFSLPKLGGERSNV